MVTRYVVAFELDGRRVLRDANGDEATFETIDAAAAAFTAFKREVVPDVRAWVEERS